MRWTIWPCWPQIEGISARWTQASSGSRLDKNSEALRYMTSPFSNPAFLTFFAAQVASLAAVGLLTMALALAPRRIDGAATGAAFVPTMDERLGERVTMMSGVLGFAALGPVILLSLTRSVLLTLWAGFGLTSSLALARGGPVITRPAQRRDRPAVFAWPLRLVAGLSAGGLAGHSRRTGTGADSVPRAGSRSGLRGNQCLACRWSAATHAPAPGSACGSPATARHSCERSGPCTPPRLPHRRPASG